MSMLNFVRKALPTSLLFAATCAVTAASPVPGGKAQKIYQENCSPCHGASGGGDGPAAAVLKPKPRNFKEGKFLYGDSVAQLKKTIKNGVNGTAMPAWGPTLKDREIEEVIQYIKSFKTP